MTVTIVTTWSDRQADFYGKQWLNGAQSWPIEWTRLVYGKPPSKLFQADSTWFKPERTTEVAALCDGNPAATGRVPMSSWVYSEISEGYSFRTDARRFAWKIFALLDAAASIDYGTLVWLDADVRTLRAPPEDLWDLIAPYDVNWLDRPGRWVETGCLVLRLPRAQPFLDELARRYRKDELFRHEQWHDGWIVTQTLREVMRRPNGMTGRPMATLPPGESGGVWNRCALLSVYFSHEKGFKRKRMVYGKEVINDVINSR